MYRGDVNKLLPLDTIQIVGSTFTRCVIISPMQYNTIQHTLESNKQVNDTYLITNLTLIA